MSYEIQGIIHHIGGTEQKGANFKSREFVIKTEGQYPNFIKFQVVQDRVEILERYNEGDKVKVFFDLRGRERNGSYFTNLQAWRVDALGQTASQPQIIPTDDNGLLF